MALLSLLGQSVAFRSLNLEGTRPKAIRNKSELFLPPTTPRRSYALRAGGEEDASGPDNKSFKGPSAKKSKSSKGKKSSKPPQKSRDDDPSAKTKEELVRAVGERMRSKKAEQSKTPEESNLFDKLNPFKAGQNLRKTIDTAFSLTSIALPPERRSMYYIDDRISELGGSARFTTRDSLLERLEQEQYIPEVLVVGATGEVGRLVVRRLLLEGRFRVRVLVRDLYTKTLNLLGTGVTYCQGDLNNVDSLAYALTDVDKIVFCATAPRPDEDQFQQKFQDFMKETLEGLQADVDSLPHVTEATEKTQSDREWEQLESVLEVRARLAEQVDCIGMENLVRAYQDVRHADYGTSQAAKRSLFKFQDRPEDFNLFAIDQDDDNGDDVAGKVVDDEGAPESADLYADFDDEEEEYDNYDDTKSDDYADEYSNYEDGYSGTQVENRRDASVKTQVQWIRNKFEHGVFVGRIPMATEGSIGGEAAIVSSRLRSRDDPDSGIDLGTGFAGFVCRVCSDGGTYEALVRTGAYYDDGVEYVCEFSTSTKPTGQNKSKNRFTTVRLPFESFKPIRRKTVEGADDADSIPAFRGGDVRNIGFRYRSASNPVKSKPEWGDLSSFYLSFCYIKLYRSQPEPEFVYVSDARIPPVVRDRMVRHGLRQLTAAVDDEVYGRDAVQLLDESILKTATQDKTGKGRSKEETYFKYRGEEILKRSGLSYTIVRVSEFNESPSGEASTIDLKSSNEGIASVSRAEVAQVCASALLDPNALNKSLYISKTSGRKSTSKDEDISSKFAKLPADAIV